MTRSDLKDSHGRRIGYLRISVTDRCNLRCKYCMGKEGVRRLPHQSILRYEELLRVVDLAAGLGVRKVRVTGGEPLVRRGVCGFLGELCRVSGIEEVTLTTNGVLLADYAREIREQGVRRVNISMDTLRRDRYRELTGEDCFHRVWKGIHEVERLGFAPIKLNVVLVRGWNDDEIADFARLAQAHPYQIRFIEFMPLGGPIRWDPRLVVPLDEVKRRIEQVVPLIPQPPPSPQSLAGPAECYAFPDGAGQVGFIGAVSHRFCSRCNRLRLTAEGKLRPCLLSDREIDLRELLRSGRSDSELRHAILRTVEMKPARHHIPENDRPLPSRAMWGIGG